MGNTYYIPRKDEDFSRWVGSFMDFLSKVRERLGFPEEVYQNLTQLRSTFLAKLRLAEAPSTRTKATIKEKNDARAALEKAIQSAVKEYLMYNHLVTDADRDNLGIPIHKTTRTPSPIADTYPDYDIDSGTIRRLTVQFYDQGQKKSKAKPAGQHGAEIRWAILESPPKKIDDLVHSSFDTRTPFTLEFDEDQRGKTVYFCLCWENTRGEKGPWSEIVNAIIP
jgi:hypothetical protein